MITSDHGKVTSVATDFVSPGGTQIQAQKDVELYCLKTKHQIKESSSNLWGLQKHSKKETHDEAIPTLFWDNGVTQITSKEGGIDARGAYFGGNGDLEMHATKRIQLGVEVLDHEVLEHSRGLNASAFGVNAINAYQNGEGVLPALTAEDATLNKIDTMAHSGHAAEYAANASNLGINLYNSTNSVLRGVAQDHLKEELLARYGLGGKDGLSPSVTLSMTESSTKTKYQTQGLGGVNRGGNVVLDAGEGIDLENGVRVHADGTMSVNAPELIAQSAGLNSSVDQKTFTQSIGSSPVTGTVGDVSLGYSHTQTKATNDVNAELSAGGQMTLGYDGGAMKQVTLDGARINAGSLDAKIDHLTINDKQDTSTTKTQSLSGSLSGTVSAYQGKGDSAKVREHSGIYVADNMGHSIEVAESRMKGGEMKIHGGETKIDKVISEKVVDHESFTGAGLSFNVNDVQRALGQKKQQMRWVNRPSQWGKSLLIERIIRQSILRSFMLVPMGLLALKKQKDRYTLPRIMEPI